MTQMKRRFGLTNKMTVSIITHVGLGGIVMKIDISSLLQVNGKQESVHLQANAELLSELSSEEIRVQKTEASGTLTKLSQVVEFKGKVLFEFAASCSRCLADVPYSISVDVDECFYDAQFVDNTVEYVYQDKAIDFSQLLKDLVWMNQPTKSLCKEDCRGLCVKCGVDKNTSNCGCVDDDLDPRFSKLKELMKE